MSPYEDGVKSFRISLIVGLCLFLLMAGTAFIPPPSFKAKPWPNHIEWTRYDVTGDGYVMCKPATPADSTQSPFVCLPLPEGTRVFIPRVVPGADPDEGQDGQWRKTAR